MILTTIEKYHTPTVIGYNLRRKNFKSQKLSHQNEIKSNLMENIYRPWDVILILPWLMLEFSFKLQGKFKLQGRFSDLFSDLYYRSMVIRQLRQRRFPCDYWMKIEKQLSRPPRNPGRMFVKKAHQQAGFQATNRE